MNVQELLSKGTPGAGPPSDADPTELLRKLMATERPSEVLPFPRYADGKPVFQYRMMVLAQRDVDQARVSAERYTKQALKGEIKLTDEQVNLVRREAWEEIYVDAKAVELLCIAMREPEQTEGKYRPLFTSSQKIRDLLTVDEIALLFTTYTTLQMKYGPLWRTLSEDELESWLSLAEEGASRDPLSALSHEALVQLSDSALSLLARSRTANSSDGSASNEQSPESSLTSSVTE